MITVNADLRDGALFYHTNMDGMEQPPVTLEDAMARHDALKTDTTGDEYNALHDALIRTGQIPDDRPAPAPADA